VYQPHGSTMLAAGDSGIDGKRYFWMNKYDSMNITFTNNTGGAAVFQVKFYGHAPGTASEIIDTVTSASIANGASYDMIRTPCNQAGISIGSYVAVTVTLSTTGGNVAISGSVDTGYPSIYSTKWCFGHHPAPNYLENTSVISSIRVTGASAMFSNIAAPLSREGQILIAQIGGGTAWTKYVGNWDELSQTPNKSLKQAATGVYGYLKPTSPIDFDMDNDVEYNKSGDLTDSHWNLDSEKDFLIIYPRITNTAASQDARWVIAFNMEYRTTDQFREVKPAEGDAGVAQEVLSHIRDFPQWYENPLHVAQILKQLKGAQIKFGNSLMKYGTMAMDAVNKYGPAISAIGSILASM
jgi:hypothetical protein